MEFVEGLSHPWRESLISLLDKTRCAFVFVGMFCVHKMNFIY